MCESVYFCRRLWICQHVYSNVSSNLILHYVSFTRRSAFTSHKTFSWTQQITALLCMKSNVVCADEIDETLAMFETFFMLSLETFCKAVYRCFAQEYFRRPNSADLRQLLNRSFMRGFTACLEILIIVSGSRMTALSLSIEIVSAIAAAPL